MKIKDVKNALECFAPLPLQEDYDNAGLQVGLTEAEVSGVLLCLDVTEEVLREAKEKGCNVVVSHHPLIFRKLARISDSDYVQRCVMYAIKNDITVLSMHTNLDSAQGGVNFMMARRLGMTGVRLIAPHTVNDVEGGIGVIGSLPEPVEAKAFIGTVKEVFKVGCVQTNGLISRRISRVALCGGAGAFVIGKALEERADAFVTGEMRYHEFFGHEDDIQIAVIGHYESEQYTIELLQEIISSRCPGVRTALTSVNTNPISYF